MSRIRIRELPYQKYLQSTSTLVRSVVVHKPTVMLYTYINRRAGTPKYRQKDTMNEPGCNSIMSYL